MVKLDRICREANVKLVFVRSYGLVGIVRVSVKVILFVQFCLKTKESLLFLSVSMAGEYAKFYCFVFLFVRSTL